MRHCNDANDVGDVVWYDPSVGNNGFVLEVFSRPDLDYETWCDVALGSQLSSEQDLAELLLDMQRNRRRR